MHHKATVPATCFYQYPTLIEKGGGVRFRDDSSPPTDSTPPLPGVPASSPTSVLPASAAAKNPRSAVSRQHSSERCTPRMIGDRGCVTTTGWGHRRLGRSMQSAEKEPFRAWFRGVSIIRIMVSGSSMVFMMVFMITIPYGRTAVQLYSCTAVPLQPHHRRYSCTASGFPAGKLERQLSRAAQLDGGGMQLS